MARPQPTPSAAEPATPAQERAALAVLKEKQRKLLTVVVAGRVIKAEERRAARDAFRKKVSELTEADRG